jgi:hypothetical protein
MTAPMTLHGSTLPTYIVKCTFNCSYQLDNTLTADFLKNGLVQELPPTFVKMPWSKEFVGATVLVVGTGCTVTSGYGGGGLIAFWMSSWRSL